MSGRRETMSDGDLGMENQGEGERRGLAKATYQETQGPVAGGTELTTRHDRLSTCVGWWEKVEY